MTFVSTALMAKDVIPPDVNYEAATVIPDVCCAILYVTEPTTAYREYVKDAVSLT